MGIEPMSRIPILPTTCNNQQSRPVQNPVQLAHKTAQSTPTWPKWSGRGPSCPRRPGGKWWRCPRCGSLEQWQDTLGRQRCGVCEGDTFGKALKLAERAARLRTQAQPRKPAPRIAPGCVPGGSVDTLDPKSNRPTQGRLRGLCGV